MLASPDDTIAALASAAGPGGRGIVRISGAECHAVLGRLFEPKDRPVWETARTAHRHEGQLRLDRQAIALPGAVYFWPGRRSYTGEPLIEIHTVSSPPLLEALLSEIHAAGARPARPGEFTLRAFLAGRIDLVQAEAVLGVIDADDHRQLEQALRQLAGGISGPLAEVRGGLLNLLADLEAGLDFVDEDISFVGRVETIARLEQARLVVKRLTAQTDERMQTTGRRRVVLAGLPNAGKSTLFNALVGSEAALVSELRGTTRDYLKGEVVWQGMPLDLIDTAGRESETAFDLATGEIFRSAQRLGGEQLEQADLVLWCTAANLDEPAIAQNELMVTDLCDRGRRLLHVRTKCDLAEGDVRAGEEAGGRDSVSVSALTEGGFEELQRAVSAILSDRENSGQNELLGSTASRCRESLRGTVECLTRAQQAADQSAGDEIVAMELREALEHLGQILGTIYTDDILDRIFSRFCIGK